MSEQAKRDLTKLSAVKGLAAWIGKRSDAIVVLVVRQDDSVLWVHERCAPVDAGDLVSELLDGMVLDAQLARDEAKARKAENVRAGQVNK